MPVGDVTLGDDCDRSRAAAVCMVEFEFVVKARAEKYAEPKFQLPRHDGYNHVSFDSSAVDAPRVSAACLNSHRVLT